MLILFSYIVFETLILKMPVSHVFLFSWWLCSVLNIPFRSPHESSWAPLLWAMKLLSQARDEGKIHMEPPVYSNLQNAFDELERNNRKLLNFSWVNFPLAYTQVNIQHIISCSLLVCFHYEFLKQTTLHTVLRQIFVHCDTFSSTFAAFPRPSCYIDNITK